MGAWSGKVVNRNTTYFLLVSIPIKMFRSPKKQHSPSKARPVLELPGCFAKTFVDSSGVTKAGRDILSHCRVVGDVAKGILKRIPEGFREKIFPGGAELVAASHDVGKVSPCFQEKIHRAINEYSPNSLPELEGVIDPELERNWGGHAGVSQATLEALNVGRYIPEIAGSHHGYTPDLGGGVALDEKFGGIEWQTQRENLVTKLKEYFGCDWPAINTPEQARALAGLTTVSDWIGSSSYFEDPSPKCEVSVEKALDDAGFIRPKLKENLSFEEIFEFAPHNLQRAFFESVNRPGVYILEAPMGLGKTEAGLYAGYSSMLRNGATGVYFALPTQLTSDKIFDRTNKFLEAILEEGSLHRQALLLHSNAWLRQTEIGVEGQPGGSWFDGAKRGILAPFAVGTIDQALMAVMNVKHGFVRAFGLVGKVVILDEVHSYDAYTGTLLDELVKGLRQLHCTVIILSATLNTERRTSLLRTIPSKHLYPLISALPNGCNLEEVAVESIPDDTVKLFYVEQANAISEALRRAERGQHVLWIENTVDKAQELYSVLAARALEISVPCGLLHSRYIRADRNRNEQHWVEFFSKAKASERGKQGRILIGTQVLEQSLDIDADFLITRFCPTDFLLQRLGRLWRHPETPRPNDTVRESWVIAPELQVAVENPEKSFGTTAFVYNPYVLCRSLEVWRKKSSIRIPGDIRNLIEATYIERKEHGKMAIWENELVHGNKGKRRVGTEAMKRLAQIGLSQAGTTLPENKVSTRYSDRDSVQVLLLKNIQLQDKGIVQLTLLNGDILMLPASIKSKDKRQWRQLAAQILQQIVNVGEYIAPKVVPRKSVYWLNDYLYLGNRDYDESLVRVALVTDGGELILIGHESASDKYCLCYNELLGYRVTKNTDEVER